MCHFEILLIFMQFHLSIINWRLKTNQNDRNNYMHTQACFASRSSLSALGGRKKRSFFDFHSTHFTQSTNYIAPPEHSFPLLYTCIFISPLDIFIFPLLINAKGSSCFMVADIFIISFITSVLRDTKRKLGMTKWRRVERKKRKREEGGLINYE